jgi:tetratricopeptide (TPR) repeat protein
MLSKIAKSISAITLLLILSGIALAQQGAVRGVVKGIKSADSGTAIVEGAIVEIYRLDIAQKFQTKSDKKGEYFHSLPAFGDYIIAISCPGFSPIISSKFRIASDQPVEQNFELAPGDGSKKTADEVRAAAKSGPAAGQAPSSADSKKAAEEAAKLEEERAKIIEKNKKIEADFSQMKKHFDEGLAFNQKNDYENAITSFKAALAIDDAQTTIYANLAQALFNLGAVRFNAKQKDSARDCFKQSADYGEKATKLDAANATYYKIYGDSCDILFKQFSISEFGDKAIAAYTTGSDLELDKTKKTLMINRIGSIYFTRGDFDKSTATYDKVLAADPNNIEALKGKASIILATTQTNTTPEDRAKLEQAMAIFQTVVDKLEAGAAKSEVEGYISYLKDTMKIEVKKDTTKKKDDKKKK